MRRLLAVLLLASGVCVAQDPALRMDQAAVRIDGKAGGTIPTGTANRFALFGSTGALTTDAGLTYSGTGATFQMLLGGTDLGLARASASTLKVTDNGSGSGYGSVLAYSYNIISGAGGTWSSSALVLPSDAAFKFSATTNATGASDLGLARASAGVLKVTDGSTGYGSIVADVIRTKPVGEVQTIDGSNDPQIRATGSSLLLGNIPVSWTATNAGATPDLGLARGGAGRLLVTDGSTGTAIVDGYGLYLNTAANGYFLPAGIAVKDSATFLWSSTSNATSPPDLGLARASAGVLKVTDGGAGNGTIGNGLSWFAPNQIQQGSGGSIVWDSTAYWNGVADLTVRRSAPATFQIGAPPNASPVANTLIVGESGSGTNIAGANGTISSGIGTGSGTGSSLIFQTPAAHGSDAVAQTPTTRLTLGPNGITLPDNGLGTVTPGTLEYKGHTAYFTTYLVRRSIVLAQEVPVTATSVGPSNVTETTVYTIPMAANYLTVGKKINVRLNGTITQRNSAASFATIRVKYAGATVFSVTTPASTALAAQPFEIDIRTVCRAIGSGTSGKLISFGKFNVNGDLVAPKLVMGALTNIDTTAANTFTVTIQWNESNASTGPFTVEMGETLCVDANT